MSLVKKLCSFAGDFLFGVQSYKNLRNDRRVFGGLTDGSFPRTKLSGGIEAATHDPVFYPFLQTISTIAAPTMVAWEMAISDVPVYLSWYFAALTAVGKVSILYGARSIHADNRRRIADEKLVLGGHEHTLSNLQCPTPLGGFGAYQGQLGGLDDDPDDEGEKWKHGTDYLLSDDLDL